MQSTNAVKQHLEDSPNVLLLKSWFLQATPGLYNDQETAVLNCSASRMSLACKTDSTKLMKDSTTPGNSKQTCAASRCLHCNSTIGTDTAVSLYHGIWHWAIDIKKLPLPGCICTMSYHMILCIICLKFTYNTTSCLTSCASSECSDLLCELCMEFSQCQAFEMPRIGGIQRTHSICHQPQGCLLVP